MTDRNPTDNDIIDEIESNGRASVSLLADIIDKNRHYVQDRVERLSNHGELVKVAPALYDRPEQAAEYIDSPVTAGGRND